MVKQILLIDDDEDEFNIFKEALDITKMSIECIYVNSAESEILWLKKYKPQVIFVDYNMPRVNGFQCVKEIRSMEESNRIPVIVYSTDTWQDLFMLDAFHAPNFFTICDVLSIFLLKARIR